MMVSRSQLHQLFQTLNGTVKLAQFTQPDAQALEQLLRVGESSTQGFEPLASFFELPSLQLFNSGSNGIRARLSPRHADGFWSHHNLPIDAHF